MEDLMELVAASFARHGIECPAVDSRLVERRASSPVSLITVALGGALEPTAIPDHNYRKSLQGDPAP
jgi:hypothetical protein